MSIKIIVQSLVTILICFIFYRLFKKKNSIVYFSGGRWWLTWLSLAIITLMDELTSIFYAPAEVYSFIGSNAIFFIIVTSLFIRYSTTKMIEISHILDNNGIKGGGVYSFSYIVLGPRVSFIAVSSILITYILTACISTVSGVENGAILIGFSQGSKYFLCVSIVWIIAFLNIIGIKGNAKFTFFVFFIAALVLSNLIVSGFMSIDSFAVEQIANSFSNSYEHLTGNGFISGYGFFTFGIASCILAYSGVESVIQTAKYVPSWKEIKKAYYFLALTVGIASPLIMILTLSSKVNVREHVGDLIPYFAFTLNGPIFGVLISLLAIFTLMMAVNISFVASSELIEKVAERYNFRWIVATNKNQSLYRIHIGFAIFNTIIIILTGANQGILAEMYALGLIASFTINMGSLIIYRYFKGTDEIKGYHTSSIGTIFAFIIFFSCFIYLLLHRPYGAILWISVTMVCFLIGIAVAKKRAPENKEIKQTDSKMGIVFYFSENDKIEKNVYFIKSNEKHNVSVEGVFITFYHPRNPIPVKIADNHFRFPIIGNQLLSNVYGIIELLKYEMPNTKFRFFIGWPKSSWIDRISTGFLVFQIMKLPKHYPEFDFFIYNNLEISNN